MGVNLLGEEVTHGEVGLLLVNVRVNQGKVLIVLTLFPLSLTGVTTVLVIETTNVLSGPLPEGPGGDQCRHHDHPVPDKSSTST